MTTLTCADCTTPYSTDLVRCPHCGSVRHMEDGVSVQRLPAFLAVSCRMDGCVMAGTQRMLRLNSPQLGLVEVPNLYCSACGGQVHIPWPPKEEPMPKITRHGGATNARETEPSPAVVASEPQVVAEDGLGHPSDTVEDAVVDAAAALADAVEPEPDYSGMTLAELRSLADERGVASYGTKAQITERLQAVDAD